MHRLVLVGARGFTSLALAAVSACGGGIAPAEIDSTISDAAISDAAAMADAGTMSDAPPAIPLCTPVTIASGQTVATSIATDATRVYWSSYVAAVSACPLDGCVGAPEQLSPSIGNQWGLTIAAGNAYWSRGGSPNEVMVCAIDDCAGTLRLFASGVGAPHAVDATSLYLNDPSLWKCPLAGCGGGPTRLTPDGVTPVGVAVRGATMYFIDRTTAELRACSSNGCGVGDRTLAKGVDSAYIAGADDVNVYFVRHWYEGSYYENDLLACPLAGCAGAPIAFAPRRPGIVPRVASDGANVYWIETSRAGTVQRCAVSGCGGRPTLVASDQDAPYGIALDATRVYWTNSHGGQVRMCPK